MGSHCLFVNSDSRLAGKRTMSSRAGHMQFARQAYLQQFHELHMRERVEDDNVLQGGPRLVASLGRSLTLEEKVSQSWRLLKLPKRRPNKLRLRLDQRLRLSCRTLGIMEDCRA